MSYLSYVSLLKFLGVALQPHIFPVALKFYCASVYSMVLFSNACHIIAELTITVASQDQQNLKRNWFYPLCLSVGKNLLPTHFRKTVYILPPNVSLSWSTGSSKKTGTEYVIFWFVPLALIQCLKHDRCLTTIWNMTLCEYKYFHIYLGNADVSFDLATRMLLNAMF